EVVRPALNNHGLVLYQLVEREQLTTILEHMETRETIVGHAPLPELDGNMQHHGSAITYARRYALAAMLGIASEEDDDAPVRPQEAVPAPESRRADSVTTETGEGEPWRWPDWAKCKGMTLAETPFTYLEWYAEHGKIDPIKAMCVQEIVARKAAADPVED